MEEKFAFEKKIEKMPKKEIRKQQDKIKRLKMPEIKTLDFLYKGGEKD